jgi:hypothetical protein
MTPKELIRVPVEILWAMRPIAMPIERLSTICVVMQAGSKEPGDESPGFTSICREFGTKRYVQICFFEANLAPVGEQSQREADDGEPLAADDCRAYIARRPV